MEPAGQAYPAAQAPLQELVDWPELPQVPASHGPEHCPLLSPAALPYRPGKQPEHEDAPTLL